MSEKLHMDFDQRVVILVDQQEWLPGSYEGESRIFLEREDTDPEHQTLVIEYLANFSADRPRVCVNGEEIFVLRGSFADEHGNYPAGSYIRNPANFQYTPTSKDGCTVFIKLNQFALGDNERKVINTNQQEWSPGHGGLKVMSLHQYGQSGTALVTWPANEKFQPHYHHGGEEVFVLSGTFKDEHGEYPTGTWMRNGHLSQHHPWVDEETVIFVKTGHLI